MKNYKKLLIYAIFSLIISGCSENESLKPAKKLEKIELDVMNVTKEFFVGDVFSYDGLIVTAFYSDNTNSIVSDYVVNEPILNEIGEKNVVVSYTFEDITKTQTYSVSVSQKNIILTFSFADGHIENKNAPYGLDDYSAYYPKNSDSVEVYRSLKTYDGWTKKYDYFFIENESIKNIYYINYELNNGVNSEDNPYKLYEGDSIDLKDAIRHNMNFKGWYLENSFTTEITKIENISKDYDLYAKFVKSPFTFEPDGSEEVKVLSDAMKDVYKNYAHGKVLSYFGKGDLYEPRDVKLTWNYEEESSKYVVYIKNEVDGGNYNAIELNSNELILTNLYTNTTYNWYVECLDSIGNTIYTSKQLSFKTEEGPRAVKIDGVLNSRDIGGYKVNSGKRIKQGMIYRSANIDSITTKGKNTFLNELNIKTDIDLRKPDLPSNPISSPSGCQNYYYLPGVYYHTKDHDIKANKSDFANEIKLFANPANYPIDFHCAIGRDRTGTLAIVLEALLGMSEKDIKMDYELSYLSMVFYSEKEVDNYNYMMNEARAAVLSFLKTYPGVSLQEQTVNYLLDAGLTHSEIDSIQSIMLCK